MALHAELAFRFPDPSADYFRLDPSEVAPGHGAFVIARAEREPVGCGAVRRIDPVTAEIKRVYVVPKHRGQGVGAAILDKLQVITGELGVSRIVAEMGIQQPDALALFRHAGFDVMPTPSALSGSNRIFMQKPLTAAK
jgi:GNAT superfamily N-acetyltransferase